MSRSLEKAKDEQDHLGWRATDATENCPVCGGDAIVVEPRNQPVDGPRDLEGYTACVSAGTAYYHRDED